MKFATPLPSAIADRYKSWATGSYAENETHHVTLADDGQFPIGMIISCCDSRVNATDVFAAAAGDFFVHRNIASLVPPQDKGMEHSGTAAAIEYGVTALGVKHIIVMGHTKCGGVAGCHAMCSGQAPELEKDTSFVGRWVEILRPGYERVVAKGVAEADQVTELEKQSVVLSLENLMTFPFVKERVENGELTLHGLSIDIRSGELRQYDADADAFTPVLG